MKIEIKIPTMGESVVEAKIGTLLKPSGSTVRADEELLEIETDKLNQVLYAPSAGKFELTAKPGDTVQVGQVIGFIDTSAAPSEAAPTPAPAPKKETPPPPKPTSSTLPPVRKTIDESLSEKPAAKKETPAKSGTRKKMSNLRRTIAQKLVEVKNQTAMLTTFNEVDMSTVMQVRTTEQENFTKKHGVKLGFMSFFVKAVVAALQEFPDINARIEGDEIVYSSTFDIGIAVGTEKGLFVPVLRNCDKLSYADIEKQLKTFAEQAKTGKLSVEDLQGGTFTITNGGVYGSLFSTPILNPPQSGILGMHNIVKRPVVVDDQIAIRPMMYLALSYDHRIVDGKESISFLMHIKKNLEEPTRLLLDL